MLTACAIFVTNKMSEMKVVKSKTVKHGLTVLTSVILMIRLPVDYRVGLTARYRDGCNQHYTSVLFSSDEIGYYNALYSTTHCTTCTRTWTTNWPKQISRAFAWRIYMRYLSRFRVVNSKKNCLTEVNVVLTYIRY